jgi:hypothetical protein
LNEAIHSEIQSLTDRLKTIDNQLYQEWYEHSPNKQMLKCVIKAIE